MTTLCRDTSLDKTRTRCSGYTVFEFDNMLEEKCKTDEIEVNEVTLEQNQTDCGRVGWKEVKDGQSSCDMMQFKS